jgi:hypothetical protein
MKSCRRSLTAEPLPKKLAREIIHMNDLCTLLLLIIIIVVGRVVDVEREEMKERKAN